MWGRPVVVVPVGAVVARLRQPSWPVNDAPPTTTDAATSVAALRTVEETNVILRLSVLPEVDVPFSGDSRCSCRSGAQPQSTG